MAAKNRTAKLRWHIQAKASNGSDKSKATVAPMPVPCYDYTVWPWPTPCCYWLTDGLPTKKEVFGNLAVAPGASRFWGFGDHRSEQVLMHHRDADRGFLSSASIRGETEMFF